MYKPTSLNKLSKNEKQSLATLSSVRDSKKHLKYTANIKIDTENNDLNKDYAEKTVALFKDVVSKIFKSE